MKVDCRYTISFKGKILNAKQYIVFRNNTSDFYFLLFYFLWVGLSIGLGKRLDTYRKSQIRSFD